MITLSFSILDLKAHAIAKKLHTDATTIDILIKSIIQATDIKVAFRICYLDEIGVDTVTIEDVKFFSRVLARNLSKVGKIFPFVLTLGKGVDALIDDTTDMLEKYLLGEIGNIALEQSRYHLERHLLNTFTFGNLSCMAPGALEDWPITEQKKLFTLLNGVESTISVKLTDSCLMIPQKSISGIYFPSEVTFYSCQLCPRKHCKNRKARFDESKARQYGI
jgi:hypothetical protein